MPTPEQAKESTADILHESESPERPNRPETLPLVDLFDRMDRETFRRVIDGPLHAVRPTPQV